ncbi:TrmJ/YjtD family RNA methyltransferase [candidate division KSB3 bacterium]|uniref:tRNA (cytidine/uridine-2'-O-)-methyltransferase TrmJ n=1 Tax=candidate division KSB3 bacterium TaxID=2044937 RepID=A0A9D5JZB2_9BACT|nr:TrmJ/YjtD family RNA methyltransferase [candidate division KSB3 bacterium]MBD3326736.1 TrmJ/YjtD family RNA methyltransferase [candidate division KSB3 bacterium]
MSDHRFDRYVQEYYVSRFEHVKTILGIFLQGLFSEKIIVKFCWSGHDAHHAELVTSYATNRVIPVQAGISTYRRWIPAFAGMTCSQAFQKSYTSRLVIFHHDAWNGMIPASLANIIVVLYQPKDPINIGASLRAMRNMGVSHLRVVEPAADDRWRIGIAAPRCEEEIAAIQRFPSLADALQDVRYTVGLTARARKANYTVMQPREACPEILGRAARGRIALLFGREDSGLPNSALTQCQAYITIPANPDYSSLNLAQAVLLMVYELFLAAQEHPVELPEAKRAFPLADHGQLEGMYQQIEATLWGIEFIKTQTSRGIMRSIRHIFSRTDLDEREVRIIRGIFHEVLKFLRRKGVDPGKRHD